MMPLPNHPSAADVFTQAQLRMLTLALEALRDDKGALARLTEEDEMQLGCAEDKVSSGMIVHEIRSKS